MFIEAVLEVDNLVFKPQSELKNPKYKKIELFDAGWVNIVLPPPPTNSSKQTLDEIKFIQKLVANATDEVKQQFINCDHDPWYYIKEVLSENNFDYKDETIERLEKSIKPIYNHYKGHFNRPRPYQVAEFLNMDFEKFKTGTANTPSYPSGHCVLAYAVGNYYTKLYPEVAEDLRKAADICAYGRCEAGLHYPSDYRAGVQLADAMMEYLNFDMISEDAPMNSTGSAVSTDTPLVKSRSLYRRKNQEYSKHLDKLLRKRYN